MSDKYGEDKPWQLTQESDEAPSYEDLREDCKRLRLEAAHANDTADAAISQVRILEAKLEKAVAFIEFLDKNYRHVWGDTARSKIRTLYAELTGGQKDE